MKGHTFVSGDSGFELDCLICGLIVSEWAIVEGATIPWCSDARATDRAHILVPGSRGDVAHCISCGIEGPDTLDCPHDVCMQCMRVTDDDSAHQVAAQWASSSQIGLSLAAYATGARVAASDVLRDIEAILRLDRPAPAECEALRALGAHVLRTLGE